MTRIDRQKIGDTAFRSQHEFREWLSKECSRSDGVVMRIYKKGSGVESITYAEALDQALCFGWIDGQKMLLDDKAWLQKFSPRRTKSKWSKRNTEHAERLIRAGQMTAAGLKEVDAAKADGRWTAAYDSPANAKLPQQFVQELDRNSKAKAFFSTLSKANLYAIAYRLQTAKRPETKAKRIGQIIEMLSRGERFH
jgi:uncharacterized protein YdeI (YjbR/CyaY-like superfamily)